MLDNFDVRIGPHEVNVRAQSAAVAPAVAAQQLSAAYADFDMSRYGEADIRVRTPPKIADVEVG